MSTDVLDATTDDVCEFLDLTAQVKDLEERVSQLKEQRGAIEVRLVERFSLSGLQNMKVNGCTIYLNVETCATIKAEFREQALEAARALELEDMITIQPQRFAAWCREQLKDEATGGKLPAEFADLVNVYERASMRVRRS